jgi:methylmalonyl-CoA epimerase
MIVTINHLGIAVKNIDEVVAFLKEAFAAQEISRQEYSELDHRSALVQIGEGCFEIMEPIASHGVIAKFLKNKGGGLHHISLLCKDVETLSKRLETQGIEVIGKTSEGPFKIAFLNPRTSKGILFELSEKPSIPLE